MSENSKINYRELLKKTAVTYEETVERIESEKQRPSIDRFRMGEDGNYNVRILPLAPYLNPDGGIDESREVRASFEYPLRQMFLDIKGTPKKAGGKPRIINIPIICATQSGVDKSVDLIDTYRKLVNDLYADDQEIVNLVNKGRFEKGLRWQNQRVMYVIDLDKDKHPVLLWQASAAQYHDFADRQVSLWNKLLAKNKDAEDPLASFGTSYALEITRKTENRKTEYAFNIDMTNDYELEDSDLEALFNSPRIPDVIYRYTRYQLEATVAFLKQYDEEHGLDVMEEEDMKNAIEQLKGELDASDNSHFDLATAGESGQGGTKLTLENLEDRYDALLDKNLSDDSEEGVDLREDIRAFVEENSIDVALKHSMSTEEMLDLIEEAMKKAPAKAKAEEPKEEPEEEPEAKDEPKEEPDVKEEEAPRRRRASRPTADDDEPEAKVEQEKQNVNDDQPEGRRRRRSR